MSYSTKSVEYFYVMVKDEPGEAYQLLALMAQSGINLLAFNAIPMGEKKTQLVLFPEDVDRFVQTANAAQMETTGPQPALLIQGDDELGALVEVHGRLRDADINVSAASGVTDGRGRFGYVMYLREEDRDRAAELLKS